MLFLSLLLSALAIQSPRSQDVLVYPETERGEVVDLHHGTEVPDPYRWLEDNDSAETLAWIEAQNSVTFDYLEGLDGRAELEARLTELWNYERYSLPVRRGGRIFYRRNDGLQAQAVLYVTDDPASPGRVLLDPATFSEDGTIALSETVPSPDGSILAYSTSDGGSDWRTWHFLEVDSGRKLADTITRNKFGGLGWLSTGSEVVYTRYVRAEGEEELVQRNAPAEICLHSLGYDEDTDVVLRERPDEGFLHWAGVDDGGERVMSIVVRQSDRHTELFLLDRAEDGSWREQCLELGFRAQDTPVGDDGRRVFVQTNHGAPNWKVIAIDPGDPTRRTTVVPEQEQAIESVSAVGGRLVVTYLMDATSRVVIVDPSTGEEQELALPGVGTVGGLGGRWDDPRTHFSFSSYTSPPRIYSCDLHSGETELFREAQVDFDPERFVTTQVFVASKDGTRVPMFLVHDRDVTPDGSNPTLLYGYGGFNISLTPGFSPVNIAWMELGGIYAVANLRGGGEYGEAWHEAGTKLQKQNVFDDFIACAEWLIEENYTRPELLGIHGGSNGGLLVGACMAQRPELFGAAIPAVGVMDMLRYHLFTIGWAWAGDYGTVDDPEEFKALLAYSPLHNLREGTAYPATLVTTAARDDRVVPAHSFKFAAALQRAHGGAAPVLIRIETRAGHGAGKPTQMMIEEAADRLSFLRANLGREGAEVR